MKDYLKKIINLAGTIFFFYRKKVINTKEIKKILVISLYFRGDTLFQTTALKLLRQHFPYIQLDVWIKSRSEEVLTSNPNINNIIIFDSIKTEDYSKNNRIDFRTKYNFLKKLRQTKYDLCIDLTGKYSTALFCLFSNSTYSLGLNYNGFGFCYSKYVHVDISNEKGHLIDKYIRVLVEGLRIPVDSTEQLTPEIFVEDILKERTYQKFKGIFDDQDKPLVSIHTTAGWEAKMWDARNFSDLIERLVNELSCNVIIVGDKSDSLNVEAILNHVKNVPLLKLKDMFSPLNLKESSVVIERSDVFVGCDSVPLHIAGAFGTPSVGLFGPTNPEFSKPRGEFHKVIYHKLHCSAPENEQYCTRDAGRTCLTLDCMRLINVNEIIDLIRTILTEKKRLKK